MPGIYSKMHLKNNTFQKILGGLMPTPEPPTGSASFFPPKIISLVVVFCLFHTPISNKCTKCTNPISDESSPDLSVIPDFFPQKKTSKMMFQK